MLTYELLGLIVLLVILVSIAGVELYMLRFGIYLKPKKPKTGRFWDPIQYPEEGEDAGFCDLCHGRLREDKIAACACGKRYHIECAKEQDCPTCGNDVRHMHIRYPLMISCPICMRPAAGGVCDYCGIILPHKDGTFHCQKCGAVVFSSDPTCRKCGTTYLPRITKGYMSRVRSRRR